MNTNSTTEDSMDEKDILEFLQHALGCTYISDLRIDPYNERAKLILDRIDMRCYSLNSIRQAIDYLYSDACSD